MTHSRLFAWLAAAVMLVSCAERQDSSADKADPIEPAARMASAANDGGIPLSISDEAAITQYSNIRSLADRGNFIEANQAARQLTESFPDFAGGWIMLGNTALSGEQFVKATRKASKLAAKCTDA